MWLISPRPRVELRLSSEPRPGSYLEGEVRLVAEERCELRSVKASLVGSCRTPDPLGLFAQTLPWGEVEARLSGPAVIPPGTSALRLRLWVPERWPPAHATAKSAYLYDLVIDVIVPGVVDGQARFPIRMGHMPVDATLGRSVTATRAAVPSFIKVELALDDDLGAPGQRLFGRFSAFGSGSASTGVSVALICCHGDPYSRGYSSEAEAARVELPVDRVPVDGTPVPFSIEIPHDALPTIDSEPVSLSWLLGIVPSGGREMPLVEVPVRVLPAGTRAERRSQKAPPIGNERLALELSRAAWGTPLKVEEGALRGAVGEVAIEIVGHAGLGARLTFPSLGIGLKIGSPSALEDLFDVGVRPREPSLRTLVVASGREEAQALSVLRALEPALSPFASVRADDESCDVVPHGNDGSPPPGPFVQAVVSLAEAWRSARAALPPPALLAPGLSSWSRLAAQLDGELEVGSMLARGGRDGRAVEAGVVWTPKGIAAATFVAVGPASPLPPGSDFTWSGGPAPPSLPPLALPLFERASEGSEALSLGPSGLRLTLSGPSVDAAPLLSRIDALVDLCSALEGRGSPYR